MNRAERMTVLVEELLAAAPRRRSRSWLAGRLEVSTRTVERDVAALQRAGLPIGTTCGRQGGYSLTTTAPPTSRVPGTVVDALSEQSVLEIDYTDRRGVATRRTVDPVGLITADRRWYLVAWCRLRGDYRAFRLDRIRRATTGDRPSNLEASDS